MALDDSLEKLERIRERGQGQPAEPHPPLNQAQPLDGQISYLSLRIGFSGWRLWDLNGCECFWVFMD